MNIKPIETRYNGYRFRSRLEARWAVFFDAMNIAYEYEPEGFDLGPLWYLPDFWLPSFSGGMYCEVKRLGEAFEKAWRFCQKTGRRIWLCEGPPDFALYHVLQNVAWMDTDGIPNKGIWATLECPNASQADGENRMYTSPCELECDPCICAIYDYDECPSIQRVLVDPQKEPFFFPYQYFAAIQAAREARFEFGETPQVRRWQESDATL